MTAKTNLDPSVFRNLIAAQLECGIGFISCGKNVEILGFTKLQNDIKNGHSIESTLPKFLRNLRSGLEDIANTSGNELGELEGTFERSFDILAGIYSDKQWDDTVEAISKFKNFDFKPMSDMLKDTNSQTRRYSELEKLKRPEFLLPIVKDMFILSFEKMYHVTQESLKHIFNEDGIKDSFELIEELLCVNYTVTGKKQIYSDARAIRNALSHPEAVDKYYHYELKLGKNEERFDPDRLLLYTSVLAAKCSTVYGLFLIFRNIALYKSSLI